MDMDYTDGETPLDPDEIEGLKHKHIETRGELNQLEQQNIQDGLNWLARQRKHNDYLNEPFLLDFHRQLFGDVWNWAGSYRQTDKNIGVDHRQIAIEVRNLLDDTRYWVEHSTYSREEFAARFHHRLVKTHLFPNGNGRHARVMTDVILERVLNVEPINWGSGLDKKGVHRKNYIDALRAADKENYQPIIDFLSN